MKADGAWDLLSVFHCPFGCFSDEAAFLGDDAEEHRELNMKQVSPLLRAKLIFIENLT
jgi:hypothetical protein